MKYKPTAANQTQIESLEPMVLLSAGQMSELADAASVQIAVDSMQQLDGGSSDDILIAFAGDNILNGGDGNDELISVRFSNELHGGNGEDTAVYWANLDEFTFVIAPGGTLLVRSGSRSDVLTGIEYLQFDDGIVAIDDVIADAMREYRSIDGTGNSMGDPDWGSTDVQLLRISSSEYDDGISKPGGEDRPSARLISNEIVAQQTSVANYRGLTDMTWLWGQFLDHDIDLTEGGSENEDYSIPVPTGDPHFDPHETGDQKIRLSRSAYDPDTGDSETGPRQQINQITAFIDGSMIYGSDEVRAAALRTFEGGLLKLSDGDLLPFNTSGLPNAGGDSEELFLAGDVRANENAALTSMHTLWAREHNRIAAELSHADPTLSDEQIYQQAREFVVAEIQAITFNEFLPALLGENAVADYDGYNPSINPGIANEFSTAAYRFGHSMLTTELLRLNNDGTVIDAGNLDLQRAFFAPQEVVQHGIDSLLRGAAGKTTSEIDTMIVDDVRNFLFGPPGAGGFDLASLNIQRGRDHGLADYSQVRAELGLDAVTDFSQITNDVQLQQKLQAVYGSVDNIDLWVGGLAEDHVDGSSLGETFRTILIDQFSRLRDGDRFWYQNVLSGDQLAEAEATTLSDVIERNSGVRGLRDNVFFLND